MNYRSQKGFNLFLMALVFSYVALFILLSSFSADTGYISPDSSNYLRLAEQILSGHGFYVPADGRSWGQEQWFSVWPVGYSSLIAATSWVSGLSVFAASKVLNCILLGANVLMLYLAFGRNGIAASLVLLTAGTMQNYTMTWSEAPFLTSLIGLVLFLAGIVKHKFSLTIVKCVLLAFLLILPFSFRYIGLFVMAPAAILVMYFFKSGRSLDAIKVSLCVICATAFCIAYLLHNIVQTGHSTGMERIPAPETNLTLLWQLAKAAIKEFILIFPSGSPGSYKQDLVLAVWVVFACISAFFVVKGGQASPAKRLNADSLLFFMFGAAYLLSIIYSRWTTQFDGFSFRLLDPGFSLIFLGLAIWILEQKNNVRMPVMSFILFSVVVVAGVGAYKIALGFWGGQTYSVNTSNLRSNYQDIPNGAIVVFAENELVYLRPDLQIANPRYRPYSSIDEEWGDFIDSLNPEADIYIQTGPRALLPTRYHETVREAVSDMPQGELFRFVK